MAYDFVEEIKNILKCDKFDENDFKISTTLNRITIEYIYSENGYSFKFEIPKMKEEVVDNNSINKLGFFKNTKWVYIFTGSLRPGKYSSSESFKYYSFNQVKSEIEDWTEYLYEELIRVSSVSYNNSYIENDKEFEKYKSQFENLKKQIDEQIDDKEMFLADEREELNNKLNEIRDDFEEQLKSLKLENEVLHNELDKMNKDFIKLQNSLKFMSKKNWFKKFISKTEEFFKDENKRKIAFTIAKGASIFLKKYNVDVPMLGEAIETIDEVSKNN